MTNLNDEIRGARMTYHNRLRVLKRLIEAELEAPADQSPSNDIRDVAAVAIQWGGCLDSLLRYKEALNRSET